MAIATLIVAALAAAFTAGAAYAAWRTSRTAADEARARTQPWVSMGVPRQDYAKDALVIPLKNLGLGPARVVALQVKDLDGKTISARIDPGLAPMESRDFIMFALFWPRLDPPTWQEVSIEGVCEDSEGNRHPIHAWGAVALPFPSYDGPMMSDESILENSELDVRAFHLKQVGRAARDGGFIPGVTEWGNYWSTSNRLGHSGDGFVTWTRSQWQKLGLPDNAFLSPDATARHLAAISEAAGAGDPHAER